ncbi:MAG: transcriptional regulator, GntR family [Acidobacteriales bacterium]|nr:transcriptional regulator, GntR family [Terriglobales bacterium]
MRFWLSRQSEVPIREQLVRQVVLGILSDELQPGRRLPSTRELARRFNVHANTISAAYRQLEDEQWVESRRGSGVYIRKSRPKAPHSPALALDQLIASLFHSAREIGVPLSKVHSRLRHWLALQPPDRFLLIEPDEELRRIVVAEMQAALKLPVKGGGLELCKASRKLAGAIPVALPSKVEAVRKALPVGTELLPLQVSSVPTSLLQLLPARKQESLIGIASRWPDFLKSARTMLGAVGFHPDSLIFRDARQPGWKKGLNQTAAVVCDSLAATNLPTGCRAIPFPVLSHSSLDELRRYEQFITHPLG